MIFRIQHLIGAAEAGFGECADVQLPDGNHALEHVRQLIRVRLVKHALIAVAGGAGLVCIDAGNDQNFILHAFLHAAQPGDIFQDRILAVGRAGPDDQKETVGLSREDLFQCAVVLFLDCGKLR